MQKLFFLKRLPKNLVRLLGKLKRKSVKEYGVTPPPSEGNAAEADHGPQVAARGRTAGHGIVAPEAAQNDRVGAITPCRVIRMKIQTRFFSTFLIQDANQIWELKHLQQGSHPSLALYFRIKAE